MSFVFLGQVPPPPPPPPPPAPLLATTGTELLEFALLIAAGIWLARRRGVNAASFVRWSILLVSVFYLAWPQDSGPQRDADRVIMHAMASLVSGLMNLGGMDSTVDGISVITPTTYTMARGCMGLTYLAMGVFCMASFPVGWRHRLAGTLGLAAGMVWLNALRILLLYHLWHAGYYDTHAWVHRIGGLFFSLFALLLFTTALQPRRRVESAAELPALAPQMAGGEA